MKNVEVGRIKLALCIFVAIFIIFILYFVTKSVFAKEVFAIKDTKDIKEKSYEKANFGQVDIWNIIKENSKQEIKEEISKQEIDLEYTTQYQTNINLPTGTIRTIQEGRDGKQEIIIKKSYKNGELIEDKQIGTKITKASLDRIVEVGGANYTIKHENKVGDILYVASNTLEMKQDASKDSPKIFTLNKDARS